MHLFDFGILGIVYLFLSYEPALDSEVVKMGVWVTYDPTVSLHLLILERFNLILAGLAPNTYIHHESR